MAAARMPRCPTAAPTVRTSCRSAGRDACQDQNGNLPRNNAIIARQSRATMLVISKSSIRSMSQFAASCGAAISERIGCASDLRQACDDAALCLDELATHEEPACKSTLARAPVPGQDRPSAWVGSPEIPSATGYVSSSSRRASRCNARISRISRCVSAEHEVLHFGPAHPFQAWAVLARSAWLARHAP